MPPTQTLARPAASATRGFTGLLPDRLLRWRRPVWWQEFGIIALGYWLYTLGRNAIPDHADAAISHGRAIQSLQDDLHLSWELAFNHLVAANEWLAQTLNYYYATLHFLVTPMVLVWLYVRRSSVYRGARTVLVSTTLISLLGFVLYPTAPPRLLPGGDYVDTVVRFRTWGSLADPDIAQHTNQFAAMPSLHMAWAIWCGVSIWMCARHRWVRVAGLAYPAATLVVIIGTANHYVLDAVAGAAVLAIGFGVQRLLSGRGAYTPPDEAPVLGRPRQES